MKMKNQGWLFVIGLLLMTSLIVAACGNPPTRDTTGGTAGQQDAAEGEEGEAADGEEGEAADGEEGEAADGEEGEDGADDEAADGEEGEDGAEGSDGDTATDLSIANKGEELNYDKNELGPVPTGEEITLTFTNDSVVNEHNFILLSTGDDAEAEEFNTAGENAGAENEYIPQDSALADMIYVRTELLATGGDEDTITFEAPEAGDYIYLCTVPGHYVAGMHGVLTVE